MSNFSQTQSGIVVPKRKAIRCGYCPRHILREDEPTGKLKIVDGRPMCPTCRVVKLGRMGKEILRDGKFYKQDVAEAKKLADKREMERVQDIAAFSVEQSGTQNEELRNKKNL